jgi:hypothetical protein
VPSGNHWDTPVLKTSYGVYLREGFITARLKPGPFSNISPTAFRRDILSFFTRCRRENGLHRQAAFFSVPDTIPDIRTSMLPEVQGDP